MFKVSEMANLNQARSSKNIDASAEMDNLINLRLSGEESVNVPIEGEYKHKLVLSEHPCVKDQHFILRYKDSTFQLLCLHPVQINDKTFTKVDGW